MPALPDAAGPFGNTRLPRRRSARGVGIASVGLLVLAGQFLLMTDLLRREQGILSMPEAGAAVPSARIGVPEVAAAAPAQPFGNVADEEVGAVVLAALPAGHGIAAPPAEARAAAPPPAPVSLPGTAAVSLAMAEEESLALDRAARRGLQRRLSLIGFDPRGIDGVFGPGTRAALAELQAGAGLPVTGFIDLRTRDVVMSRSEPAFRRWRAAVEARRQAEETRRLAAAAADLFDERTPPGTCARRGEGSVVARQGLLCDLTGMGEGVVGLVKALGTL